MSRSLLSGGCLTLAMVVVCFAQRGQVPMVRVHGIVDPPQARAAPVRTNWNVKIEIIFDNPDTGRTHVHKTRTLSADSNGDFYWETIPYPDVRNARLRITVLGGFAYKDDVKFVQAGRSGDHKVRFSMERR